MLSFFKYYAAQTVFSYNDPMTFVECVRLYDELSNAAKDTEDSGDQLESIFDVWGLEPMDSIKELSQAELVDFMEELAEGAANAATKRVIKGFDVSYCNWRGTPGSVYVSTDDSEAAGSGLDCFGVREDQIYYYFQLENPCEFSTDESKQLTAELTSNLGEGVPADKENKTRVRVITVIYED